MRLRAPEFLGVQLGEPGGRYLQEPEAIMYAGPDAFARRHADGHEEHGDEEQGDGKGHLVDSDVARHLHTVGANFEVDACGIEVAKDML